MRGSRGGRGSGPPLENQNCIGFLSNTGLDPLKNPIFDIQYWAIIGKPVKRHLNGVSKASR